jgi:citronellol/citronellal dehydrogenase
MTDTTTSNGARFANDLMAGQVALVTGSGSGMGRTTALEMAGCGARLVLFARRVEPLEETAEMIRAAGGEALVVVGDTREEDTIEAAMQAIREHYGRLDVLVNNAGGQFIAPARDITNKGFAAVIRNNLIGSWQMTRAAADHFMFDNGGSVVFVTAISRTALTGFAHTAAARAGVTGLMKTLAAEWGEYGIRLNCVAPGTVKTEALARYPIPPEMWQQLNRSVLNRIGSPAGRCRHHHLPRLEARRFHHRRGLVCGRRRDPAHGPRRARHDQPGQVRRRGEGMRQPG